MQAYSEMKEDMAAKDGVVEELKEKLQAAEYHIAALKTDAAKQIEALKRAAEQTRSAERAMATWKARTEEFEPADPRAVLGGQMRHTSQYRRSLGMSP